MKCDCSLKGCVTWSIKMPLITQKNQSSKMAILESITGTYVLDNRRALTCVFDVTATLFSVSLSVRRAIGKDLFPLRLESWFLHYLKIFLLALLLALTSFNILSLDDPSRSSIFAYDYLYARDNAMHFAAGAKISKRKWSKINIVYIESAWNGKTVNVQFLVSHKLNNVLDSYFDVARGKEREWIMNPWHAIFAKFYK